MGVRREGGYWLTLRRLGVKRVNGLKMGVAKANFRYLVKRLQKCTILELVHFQGYCSDPKIEQKYVKCTRSA